MKNKKIKTGFITLLIVILAATSVFAAVQKQSNKDDNLIKESALTMMKSCEYAYINGFGSNNDIGSLLDSMSKDKSFQIDFKKLKELVNDKKKVSSFINETDNLRYKLYDLFNARSSNNNTQESKADKEFIKVYLAYVDKYDKGRDVNFQKQVAIDDKLIKEALAKTLECYEYVYIEGFGDEKYISDFLEEIKQNKNYQVDFNELQEKVQNKKRVNDFIKSTNELADKTYDLLDARKLYYQNPNSEFKQNEATKAFQQAYLEFVSKYDKDRDVTFLVTFAKEIENPELKIDVSDHFNENDEFDESKIVH